MMPRLKFLEQPSAHPSSEPGHGAEPVLLTVWGATAPGVESGAPQQLRQLGDIDGYAPGLILREAPHIGPSEVPHIGPSEVGHRGASREMPRRGTRREVSRTAARGEVARMAGYLDLIRSLDQGAARRRPPEPHNLAHKMKRVSQLFRRIRK